jgi:hypothetical protein
VRVSSFVAWSLVLVVRSDSRGDGSFTPGEAEICTGFLWPRGRCAVALVDSAARSVMWANAGHPAALLITRTGLHLLPASGPPAGMFPDSRYAEELLRLFPGDRCVIVTDGVTEALADGGPDPADQVAAVAATLAGAGAGDACDAIMRLSLAACGPRGVSDWDDDRTVVVIGCAHRSSDGPLTAGESAGSRPR